MYASELRSHLDDWDRPSPRWPRCAARSRGDPGVRPRPVRTRNHVGDTATPVAMEFAVRPRMRCANTQGESTTSPLTRTSGPFLAELHVETTAQELEYLPGPGVDVPVVVAVNGAAAGGGLNFVADADIATSSSTGKFLDPHLSVGQASGVLPLLLRQRIAPTVVTRMALSGRHEVLDAEQARSAGLVSEVMEAEHLLALARYRRRDQLQLPRGSPPDPPLAAHLRAQHGGHQPRHGLGVRAAPAAPPRALTPTHRTGRTRWRPARPCVVALPGPSLRVRRGPASAAGRWGLAGATSPPARPRRAR